METDEACIALTPMAHYFSYNTSHYVQTHKHYFLGISTYHAYFRLEFCECHHDVLVVEVLSMIFRCTSLSMKRASFSIKNILGHIVYK